MEVFFANDPESKQFDDIKLWIRKHMDGSVSSKMESTGLHYTVNYGVSIVHLRKYAAQNDISPRLALRLWNSNVRECMLLGSLFFSGEMVVAHSDVLIAKISNIELAEQFAFNAGYKVLNPSVFFLDWLKLDEEYVQVTAILSVATALQKGISANSEQLKIFFEAVCQLSVSTVSMQRAVTRLLVNLIKIIEVKPSVVALADVWISSESSFKMAVARDILIELEYS